MLYHLYKYIFISHPSFITNEIFYKRYVRNRVMYTLWRSWFVLQSASIFISLVSNLIPEGFQSWYHLLFEILNGIVYCRMELSIFLSRLCVFLGEVMSEPQTTAEEQSSVHPGYFTWHLPAPEADSVQIRGEPETYSVKREWLFQSVHRQPDEEVQKSNSPL